MDCDLFDKALRAQIQDSDPTTGEGIDELEDESDSLAAALAFDEELSAPGSGLRDIAIPSEGRASKVGRTGVELANAAVTKASENVVVKSTLNEYARYRQK